MVGVVGMLYKQMELFQSTHKEAFGTILAIHRVGIEKLFLLYEL